MHAKWPCILSLPLQMSTKSATGALAPQGFALFSNQTTARHAMRRINDLSFDHDQHLRVRIPCACALPFPQSIHRSCRILDACSIHVHNIDISPAAPDRLVQPKRSPPACSTYDPHASIVQHEGYWGQAQASAVQLLVLTSP